MKNFISVLILALLMTMLPTSCNKEKSDYNKAKKSGSVEELKTYIADNPGSVYVDSANALIEKLTWQQALLANRTAAYEQYLENYPEGKYTGEALAQLAEKKENLKLALKAFNRAQQAVDEIEMVELYSTADSLFKLVDFADLIVEGYKEPTINLHLDQNDKLSDQIARSFSTTRYLYGQPVAETFIHDLGSGRINNNISYKIILGSAGVTDFTLLIELLRDGKVVTTLGEDNYNVRSNRYNSFIGFFYNDGVDFLPGDKLRFVIKASGSNYGKACGNFESYLKAVQPAADLDDNVLSERMRAVEWCASSCSWTHPAAMVMDFIAQLDYCVLNNKNATWNFGGGSQKDGQPYRVTWKNDSLNIKQLSEEEIDILDIKENNMSFTLL